MTETAPEQAPTRSELLHLLRGPLKVWVGLILSGNSVVVVYTGLTEEAVNEKVAEYVRETWEGDRNDPILEAVTSLIKHYLGHHPHHHLEIHQTLL